MTEKKLKADVDMARKVQKTKNELVPSMGAKVENFRFTNPFEARKKKQKAEAEAIVRGK